jgi:hypothetical protein
VLGEALLDLARLLVGVHVERQPFGCCVGSDLLEPFGRAGADGVGGDADPDAAARNVSTWPRNSAGLLA